MLSVYFIFLQFNYYSIAPLLCLHRAHLPQQTIYHQLPTFFTALIRRAMMRYVSNLRRFQGKPPMLRYLYCSMARCPVESKVCCVCKSFVGMLSKYGNVRFGTTRPSDPLNRRVNGRVRDVTGRSVHSHRPCLHSRWVWGVPLGGIRFSSGHLSTGMA